MPATKSKFAQIDEQLAAAPTCKLCAFFADAAKADVEYVQGMLETASSSHTARVLTAGGVEITESSVKRHKRLHTAA